MNDLYITSDYYFSGTKKPIRRNTGKIMRTKKAPIRDARNKIIQKTRMKIRDARDKLAEITREKGDARLKLMKRQKSRPKVTPSPTKLSELKSGPPPMRLYRTRNFDMMDVDDMYPVRPVTLQRTIKNDIASMPPFPSFRTASARDPRSPSVWETSDDPFDCYELPISRPANVAEPIRVRSLGYSPELQPRKGILRTSAPSNRYVPNESSQLSFEMRSRLERAPDPHASMGIFANNPPVVEEPKGYRIVVSNLHSSVTQSDIRELFEPMGDLLEARLVRPGVAEVIFYSLNDATKAVDTYHNRHLDGQPMKCLLVKPRSSSKPTASAIRLPSSNNMGGAIKKKSIEVDIDALHSVLFRRT